MRYSVFNDDTLVRFNNKIKYSFIIEEDKHLLKEESKIL